MLVPAFTSFLKQIGLKKDFSFRTQTCVHGGQSTMNSQQEPTLVKGCATCLKTLNNRIGQTLRIEVEIGRQSMPSLEVQE